VLVVLDTIVPVRPLKLYLRVCVKLLLFLAIEIVVVLPIFAAVAVTLDALGIVSRVTVALPLTLAPSCDVPVGAVAEPAI
jgi:hypothetical protein